MTESYSGSLAYLMAPGCSSGLHDTAGYPAEKRYCSSLTGYDDKHSSCSTCAHGDLEGQTVKLNETMFYENYPHYGPVC